MKNHRIFMLLYVMCTLSALALSEEEVRQYGRDITIKNLSPAKLTITVNNDPDSPTIVIIQGNATGSVLVSEPKLNVHIEANANGKIKKSNFKRKKSTENYWEISIRKAIIGSIEIIKRESKILNVDNH